MRSTVLICAALASLVIALISIIVPHLRFSQDLLALASNFRRQGSAAKMTMQPRYYRIRLKTDEDLDKSYPLFISYLKQPDLASSVQEIVLDRPFPQYGCYLPPDGEGSREEMTKSEHDQEENLIIETVKSLSFEDENEQQVQNALIWKKRTLDTTRPGRAADISAGRADRKSVYAQSVSSMLLSLCPDVQRLTVSEIGSPLREFFIRTNYGLLPTTRLQSLRHVRFRFDYGYPLYDGRFYTHFDVLDALRTFHRLPAIESVSVNGIAEDPDGRTALPPHTSNLKKIRIGHSDVSSLTLASIIRLPKALEEFSFSIGGRSTRDGGFALIYPKTLGKAFLCHKSSLKVLNMDVDEYLHTMPGRNDQEDLDDEHDLEWAQDELSWQRDNYWEMDDVESRGPLFTKDLPDTRVYGETMGSLRDFEALTHLSIGVKLLLGHEGPAPFRLIDALPQSLEFLCIRGYKAGENPEYMDQIQELMDKKAEKLPNLKEVQGVEREVPSARTIMGRNEDHYKHLLWREQDEDDGWLEA